LPAVWPSLEPPFDAVTIPSRTLGRPTIKAAAHAGGLSRAGAGRHGAKDPRREVKPAARAGSSSAGTSGGISLEDYATVAYQR